MFLPGVADCCRLIRHFAFTSFAALLISITVCFDLPAFASFKRQTNGKNFVFAKAVNAKSDLRAIGTILKREVVASIVLVAPA